MERKSSFDVLRAYLEARASFTEEELAYLRTMFIPVTLGPGEFLQRGGEVAKYTGFVAVGCPFGPNTRSRGESNHSAALPQKLNRRETDLRTYRRTCDLLATFDVGVMY
jgi:hypothetical protein